MTLNNFRRAVILILAIQAALGLADALTYFTHINFFEKIVYVANGRTLGLVIRIASTLETRFLAAIFELILSFLLIFVIGKIMNHGRPQKFPPIRPSHANYEDPRTNDGATNDVAVPAIDPNKIQIDETLVLPYHYGLLTEFKKIEVKKPKHQEMSTDCLAAKNALLQAYSVGDFSLRMMSEMPSLKISFYEAMSHPNFHRILGRQTRINQTIDDKRDEMILAIDLLCLNIKLNDKEREYLISVFDEEFGILKNFCRIII
jgi:hypothetical protein